MKFVVGGKLYDTDTAKYIGKQDFYNIRGICFGSLYRRKQLYQKKNGEFFFVDVYEPLNTYDEPERLDFATPCEASVAKDWIRTHLDYETFVSVFGEPEDYGPDRDTDTSEFVGANISFEPERSRYIYTALYRETNGEFFFFSSDDRFESYEPRLCCGSIDPIEAKDAREWACKHLSYDTYASIFLRPKEYGTDDRIMFIGKHRYPTGRCSEYNRKELYMTQNGEFFFMDIVDTAYIAEGNSFVLPLDGRIRSFSKCDISSAKDFVWEYVGPDTYISLFGEPEE